MNTRFKFETQESTSQLVVMLLEKLDVFTLLDLQKILMFVELEIQDREDKGLLDETDQRRN